MELMDMAGRSCGHTDITTAPEGFWLRDDNRPTAIPRGDFLDRLGKANFARLWTAMLANSDIAFLAWRAQAAEAIHIETGFPALIDLERAGVLPEGTAIAVFS